MRIFVLGVVLAAAFGCTVPETTKADVDLRDHGKNDDDGKGTTDDPGRSLEAPIEVACENACAVGDKRCAPDQGASSTQICAEVEGCLRFTQGQDCTGDTSCDLQKNDGSCKPGCTNDPGCHELSVGLEKCAATGGRSRVACRKEGACFKWLAVTACSPDETCGEGGLCKARCTNACTSGATRCVAGALAMERCTTGTNGCTSWSRSSCAASHVCVSGICGPI